MNTLVMGLRSTGQARAGLFPLLTATLGVVALCLYPQSGLGEITRNEVEQYAYRIAGGTAAVSDDVLKTELAEVSYNGLNWLDTLGWVLATDRVVQLIQRSEYVPAVEEAAKHTSLFLVSKTALGGIASSAAAIGSLAALPLERFLQNYASGARDEALGWQMKLYLTARSPPYRYSNDDLVRWSAEAMEGNAIDENRDIQFYANGWIAWVGSETASRGYLPRTNDIFGQYGPREFFTVAESLYATAVSGERFDSDKQKLESAFRDAVRRAPSQARAALSFHGMAQDLVSQRYSATPDGSPDGVFEVQLSVESAKTITGLLMQLVDEDGQPILGQVWDTEPGGYWMLGVMADQRFLNPSDESVRVQVSGTEDFTLYASNSGYFEGGRRYRLTATFSDHSEAVAYTTIGSTGQGSSACRAIDFHFAGVTRDLVSIRDHARPDGADDGAFELQLSCTERETITNMMIHLVDETGEAIWGQVWDTQPGGYWMIGVLRDGIFVNQGDQSVRIPVAGSERFTLYVSDSGYFRPGSRFRVSVRFSSGAEAVGYTDI